ncbi:hypothetical protein RAMDARK_1908 [Rickettsia amblyommatis str. Darkwater]|nr:hypothetical protein RAMDARK_1908 [Rickettsia amblyommatis str. Darkwater]
MIWRFAILLKQRQHLSGLPTNKKINKLINEIKEERARNTKNARKPN